MSVSYRGLTTAVAIVLASPALCQNLESMRVAHDLGSVLGAEKSCGLSYNQKAIADWVDANVDAGDMGFAGTLSMMTKGAEYELSGLSESAKTAHCRAVERTARHYGFIE